MLSTAAKPRTRLLNLFFKRCGDGSVRKDGETQRICLLRTYPCDKALDPGVLLRNPFHCVAFRDSLTPSWPGLLAAILGGRKQKSKKGDETNEVSASWIPRAYLPQATNGEHT